MSSGISRGASLSVCCWPRWKRQHVTALTCPCLSAVLWLRLYVTIFSCFITVLWQHSYVIIARLASWFSYILYPWHFVNVWYIPTQGWLVNTMSASMIPKWWISHFPSCICAQGCHSFRHWVIWLLILVWVLNDFDRGFRGTTSWTMLYHQFNQFRIV